MKITAAYVWELFEKFLRAAVGLLLKPTGKKLSDAQWSAFMQFVKFGMVGFMNTLLDYAVYLVTLKLFTVTGLFGEKAYLVSTILGFIVSFFNMFYWNNKYVFKEKDGETRSPLMSLVKLFLSYAVTGVAVKPACMYVLVDIVGFYESLAPIPVMFVTIPLNFVLSKLWAFKGKKESER